MATLTNEMILQRKGKVQAPKEAEIPVRNSITGALVQEVTLTEGPLKDIQCFRFKVNSPFAEKDEQGNVKPETQNWGFLMDGEFQGKEGLLVYLQKGPNLDADSALITGFLWQNTNSTTGQTFYSGQAVFSYGSCQVTFNPQDSTVAEGTKFGYLNLRYNAQRDPKNQATQKQNNSRY